MELLSPLSEVQQKWNGLSHVDRAYYLLLVSQDVITEEILLRWLHVQLESLSRSEIAKFNRLLRDARRGQQESVPTYRIMRNGYEDPEMLRAAETTIFGSTVRNFLSGATE